MPSKLFELDVNIKPLVEGLKNIEQEYQNEWYDLRSAETVELKKDEYRKLRLGIQVKLPRNCEAMITARSSTFEKWGILVVNSPLVIDNKYDGEWFLPVIAARDTKIYKNDRICQFRINWTQFDWTINMEEK